MGASKRSYEDLRNSDIKENMSEGIPLYHSAPKDEPIDYSLNDFEGLVKHASKYNQKDRELILDAVKEYKRLMDQF